MPLHPLLARALRRHGLKRFFNSLSESTRNEFDHFIRSVKKEPTRLRRLEQTIELLATAREAELDPPPALKAALAANPQARRGWELLPQQSRRWFLIDIFRSPYPDTRARHLEWAVREWASYGSRHDSNPQTGTAITTTVGNTAEEGGFQPPVKTGKKFNGL